MVKLYPNKSTTKEIHCTILLEVDACWRKNKLYYYYVCFDKFESAEFNTAHIK